MQRLPRRRLHFSGHFPPVNTSLPQRRSSRKLHVKICIASNAQSMCHIRSRNNTYATVFKVLRAFSTRLSIVRNRGTLLTARRIVDTRSTQRNRVRSIGLGVWPISKRKEKTSEQRMMARSIMCENLLRRKRGILHAANIFSPISSVNMKLNAITERLINCIHTWLMTTSPRGQRSALMSEQSALQQLSAGSCATNTLAAVPSKWRMARTATLPRTTSADPEAK
mmetsp:Transcript_54835/g.114696  ORF Transcript_54835/g.114696 Transcript_54835/m.114696 type:complete len:224 (-) Transcript_54835:406-1077(-)